jgi:hypothetical protein
MKIDGSGRTFRDFLRDYIDDIIRLVALAALCGALLSAHADSVIVYVVAAFLGALTFAMLMWTTYSVVEYGNERLPARPTIVISAAVFVFNSIAVGSVFYVAVMIVSNALRP